MLEAQDLLQGQIRAQRPVRGLRALRGNLEAPVVSWQKLLQHPIGFPDAAGACQPEFGNQPVLEGSRSPLHAALGLWREGEYHLYPQLIHGPAELGRRSGEAGPRCVPEDPVPVDVEGDGNANALQQVLDQQEIGVGLLLLTEQGLTEQGVGHRAGGIIDCDQQRERRNLVPQPRVVAAVHLDQHPLSGHSLAAYPVLGRTPSLRTLQPGVDQDASQRGSADVNSLALVQQLAEMGVVGPRIPGASQMDHIVRHGLGSRIGRSATPVAVGNRGSSLFPVGRQHAPGVPSADTQRRGRLIQRHVLCQQAVENL